MNMKERERELYYIRRSVKDFLHRIKNYTITGPVLEVGKMLKEGKVYSEFPDLYVDTAKLFPDNRLIHLDIDAATKPDICDDVVNVDRHFKPGEVGAIVLLHVLEHVFASASHKCCDA